MTGLSLLPTSLADARQIVARPDHHPVEVVLAACDDLIGHGDWMDVSRGTALKASISRDRSEGAGLRAIEDGLMALEADFLRLADRAVKRLWIAAAATIVAITILVFDQRRETVAPAAVIPTAPSPQHAPALRERQNGVRYGQAE